MGLLDIHEDGTPMKPDIFERRPLLLLVALVLLFFWKLIFSSQFTFLDSPDLAFQVLPWYQVQALAWNAGEFPLWDPYQWTGQSLLGQMQPGAAFPLNWPLFLAPLDEGYDRLTAKDGSPYFVLKAANDEVIGKSETYSSKSKMENGIDSVKKNAPSVVVAELV